MKITALGTGTSQGIPNIGCQCEVCLSEDPADKRLRAAIYIESPQTKLLIDIGPDFRTQFLDNKLTDVDLVLITHEHNDHIIGLDDIRAINYRQQKNIPFYASPRVSKEISTKFDYVFKHNPHPSLPQITLHEVDDRPFQYQDLTITPIRITHGRLPILGYKINNMAYITDASYIEPSELKKLEGLDLLIINALRKEKHHSHFTLDEALDTIALLQPKRSYLTHISHLMGKNAEWEKTLPPNVSSLKDRMVIQLPDQT